jgi:predicted MFS family arabinose efflux permease
MGLGAAAFGLLAAHVGYPVTFALTAALILAAVGPAIADRKEKLLPVSAASR